MDIFLRIILVIIGLVLIVKGGDLFVEASVWIARIAHIKELIIGATIVSIGTTIPELLTSLTATIRGVSMGGDEGYFALALSNAVGSMLCNSALILALVIAIRPPKYDKDTMQRSMIYVWLVSLLIVVFMFTGVSVSKVEGVVLLLLFVAFMTENVLRAIRHAKGEITRGELDLYNRARNESKVKMIACFLLGAIAIAVGAVLLVDNSKSLAISMGISEAVVGVTLVAVGTSLPELVTSMTALKKGNSDIGVGNIMGAHMINATLIVGLIAVIVKNGIAVDDITRCVTGPVLLLIISILVLPTIIRGKFGRAQGFLMLAIYLAFVCGNVYLTIK